ncbi:GHMP kinase [bacterium]|nr:GHMP kinase [bacterium]
MTSFSSAAVSAPGRICLFGEHQDYLHLPVIPCAISLRVHLEGRNTDASTIMLDLPDIQSRQSFSMNGELAYVEERDYFRSGLNVIKRQGYSFSSGLDVKVHGNIPINSGTSSSSALLVAWIYFLARMSDRHVDMDAAEVARLAYEAEVLEFNEPGGMMDHFSTALGGIIYLDFEPEIECHSIAANPGTFVLGDSCEPKDTKGILSRVKDGVLHIVDELKKDDPAFELRRLNTDNVQQYKTNLSTSAFALLEGTVANHLITRKAKDALQASVLDHALIGNLLNEHQAILRDVLGISTPKIDRMLDAALKAGALGGKINGSGGGGCMFAYAPENPAAVAEAIERAGGKAYIVTVADGVRLDK